jgi:predicted DNA-binding transcriptional regulator AlpA
MPVKLLTFKELSALLGGRSRSTIYVDLALGRLPKPIRLGGKCYWPSDVIEDHIRRLAEAARGGKAA